MCVCVCICADIDIWAIYIFGRFVCVCVCMYPIYQCLYTVIKLFNSNVLLERLFFVVVVVVVVIVFDLIDLSDPTINLFWFR